MRWLALAGVLGIAVLVFLLVDRDRRRGPGERPLGRDVAAARRAPPSSPAGVSEKPLVPEPAALIVEVFDKKSPVPRADVVLLTDAMVPVEPRLREMRPGTWRRDELEPGDWYVQVGADGYTPNGALVVVEPGENRYDFELEEGPALHGVVLEKGGGALSGITVSFGWTGSPHAVEAVTSPSGAFHLEPRAHEGPAWYGTVSARDPRGIHEEVQVAGVKPYDGPVRVEMARATIVTGRLVPWPRDVPEIEIGMTWDGEAPDGSSGRAEGLAVAPDGTFRVAGLPMGLDAYLTLRPGEAAPIVIGPFRLHPGEQRVLGDLAVGPGLALRIEVRAKNGSTLADAEVDVYTPGPLEPRRVHGDASGIVEIGHLPAGHVLLGVRAPGHATRWVRVPDVARARLGRIVLKKAALLIVDVKKKGQPWQADLITTVERPDPVDEYATHVLDWRKWTAHGKWSGWFDPGLYTFRIREMPDGDDLAVKEIVLKSGETRRLAFEIGD